MSKYNGWTNYATWRISLEFFDGMAGEHIDSNWERLELEERAALAAEYLNGYVDEMVGDSILNGWVHAFIADVDFEEIAKHISDD